MVLRKPVSSSLVPPPLRQAVNDPPYPMSPTASHPLSDPLSNEAYDASPHDSHTSSAVEPSNLQKRQQSTSDSDSDFNGSEWDSDENDEEHIPDDVQNMPAPLKVTGTKAEPSIVGREQEIPVSLRVGPSEGVPRRSQDSQRSDVAGVPASRDRSRDSSRVRRSSITLQSHNPYLRMQNTGQTDFGGDSSASVWADAALSAPAHPPAQPPAAELAAEQTPVEPMSKLSLCDQPKDSYDWGLPESPTSKQPQLIPVATETTATIHIRHDSEVPSPWNPGFDISSLDALSSRNHGLPTESGTHPLTQPIRTWQEQQVWEQSERERRELEAAAAQERAQQEDQLRRAEEEWHRGEALAVEQGAPGRPEEEGLPQLPPRKSAEVVEQPPPKPPRPRVSVSPSPPGRPEIETPSTKARRQRKEHYQIRHVHWYDASQRRLRPSPILMQNANGPCPLLALVNALVLSTPAEEDTALVETLRTREQVSLGLLLDAVFDELMSGRRGDAAQELPDVGDLYAFLVTLHTGMNVNPRFVAPESATTEPSRSEDGKIVNVPDVHPALRNQAQPGSFEQTRELNLYSTFNIPLIHGWLPTPGSRAHTAFDRVAKTYEEAQNMQFHEEELEEKLRRTGLDVNEQQLFEDLQIIKQFLTQWPTQLTDYGLDAISKGMQPGRFAILFRNDHFSTLYKEPRSGQILTLVTDAGYASHDEIVWESLVDVSGQGSELYSGDFRPVGNMSHAGPAGPRGSSRSEPPIRSLLDDDDQGWTTVANKRNRQGAPGDATATSGSGVFQQQQTGVVGAASTDATAPSASAASNSKSATEQEDHDLALALQLQEEEEDRHRREQEARRQREDQLSQRFLEGERIAQGPRNPPLIPPRRSNLPRQTGSSADDLPPPTYEQAASGRPYHPPRDHPASPHAPLTAALNRQQSAYGQQSSINVAAAPAQMGRRRSSRQGVPLVDQIPLGSGMGRGGRRSSSGAVNGTNAVGDADRCLVM